MLEDVTYAQAEGRKFGLRVDITICSGWPYGGPSTKLSEAAGSLRFVAVQVPLAATSLPLVKLADGESIITTSVAAGTSIK